MAYTMACKIYTTVTCKLAFMLEITDDANFEHSSMGVFPRVYPYCMFEYYILQIMILFRHSVF